MLKPASTLSAVGFRSANDGMQQSLAPRLLHQPWPIMQLLSDKYGLGKYDDDMKDEQCLYRKGSKLGICRLASASGV
jgi:hypothetical protein